MERIVLGKCPKCGADVVSGKYGAYCLGKCGMMVSKAFGKELSDDQVRGLLGGEKILVEDLVSKNTGNTYSIFLKANGYEDYSYTKKDGTQGSGSRFVFETEFPEKNKEQEPERRILGTVRITSCDESEMPFR